MAVDAGAGDLDGRDEVFAAVGAQHPDRDLAPGEDHRFGEVLQQEAQCRGRIGHRVGSVQHDETVVAGIVVADQLGQGDPVRRFDVRRVDHRIDRVDIDVDVEPFERGELLVDAAEVEGHQGSGGGIGLHADGAARVDDQNGGSHIVLGSCPLIFLVFAVGIRFRSGGVAADGVPACSTLFAVGGSVPLFCSRRAVALSRGGHGGAAVGSTGALRGQRPAAPRRAPPPESLPGGSRRCTRASPRRGSSSSRRRSPSRREPAP